MLLRDNVIATALLNCLLHHAQVININGQSYRLKDRINSITVSLSFRSSSGKELGVQSPGYFGQFISVLTSHNRYYLFQYKLTPISATIYCAWQQNIYQGFFADTTPTTVLYVPLPVYTIPPLSPLPTVTEALIKFVNVIPFFFESMC